MNTINALLTKVGELILAPATDWPPIITLVVCSIVAGVVMTIVFRFTSNQKALRSITNRTRAELLSLKLFRDDLGVALRAQGRLLRLIGLRLAYSLVPMAVMVIPFVIVLTQLALRYEHRPLRAGESAVVELHLSPADWEKGRDTVLDVPTGVTIEIPPLRDGAAHAVYWRIRVDTDQVEPLGWRVGDTSVEKRLTVVGSENQLLTVNPRRAGPGLWDRIAHPGEPAFASDSPVQAVVVRYPDRVTPIFGLRIAWWVTFLVVSMLTALVVRPFLKVQF
ncbi:MAG: hypothetical protein KAS72_14940 [Phycisphaerales bacterium]|nr:hypothetical protein [Phycisphaerales bacterium]